MIDITLLWKAPKVNPLNHKAQSVPVLNLHNMYGRQLFFSMMGFMIAFVGWYSFPPLMTKTIKADLHLTQDEISNSNILALTATCLVRFAAGPLCDRFGPRYVYIGILLLGSIPTVLAGTVTSATGLSILRFFVGMLGATFVPCQVWTTGFYDKNVVGTANALAAGIGNAGGGITYFVMPVVFDSLVQHRHLTPHVAWRVAFIVPYILITATALGMLFLCEDTPTGKWSDRHLHARQDAETVLQGIAPSEHQSSVDVSASDEKKDLKSLEKGGIDKETEIELVIANEVVQSPSFKEACTVVFSWQALMLAVPYACSFGGELAINSILGAYYNKNFPHLGQTKSGRWAAMFGLVNVVTRPLGGIIADIIYGNGFTKGSVQAKKFWLFFVCLMMGMFCVLIGFINSHHHGTMVGLVFGLAFFMDGANGANFAVVPHVFPYANGILSGTVGASGNLGGVIWAIIFRYNGANYAKSMWITGFAMIAVNLAVCWIKPIPKGQLGSHR